MRRIVMWLLSTVTVVVLLFGYHTSTSGPTTNGSSVVSSGSTGVSGSLDGSAAAAGSSGSSSSGTTSTAAAQTVTGDSVQTRWGPVEVQITVAGGKITAVDVPVYPSGNGRDEEINSYALPRLIQETLAAQGADIDMVSGATVTSDGYLQSLQAALDKAGV